MVSFNRIAPRKLPLTEAQIRALAFSGFQKPLRASPIELRLNTGLQGASLSLVCRALENRGLVDRAGAITQSGMAALERYRPVHVG